MVISIQEVVSCLENWCVFWVHFQPSIGWLLLLVCFMIYWECNTQQYWNTNVNSIFLLIWWKALYNQLNTRQLPMNAVNTSYLTINSISLKRSVFSPLFCDSCQIFAIKSLSCVVVQWWTFIFLFTYCSNLLVWQVMVTLEGLQRVQKRISHHLTACLGQESWLCSTVTFLHTQLFSFQLFGFGTLVVGTNDWNVSACIKKLVLNDPRSQVASLQHSCNNGQASQGESIRFICHCFKQLQRQASSFCLNLGHYSLWSLAINLT